MFERRLRILLYTLFLVACGLLARAFQLQVFAHDDWQKQAEGLGHRRHLIETVRGSIKDLHGVEIAVDQPCIDACVEYGAIAKDADWMKALALKRLAVSQPGVYRRAHEAARAELLSGAVAKISQDIDHMFEALSRETGQPMDKIEDARTAIQQRVEIRQRFLQFSKYEKAAKDKKEQTEGATSWYQRMLAAGTSDTVDIDEFEIRSVDKQQAHPIVRHIRSDTYTKLAKEIDQYPGLVLKEGSYRLYPRKEAACHVLGTVGVVDKKVLDSDENEVRDDLTRYLPNDVAGRGGIEQLAEPALRGTRGYVEFPAGQPDNILVEKKAVPGASVQTTIDIELAAEVQSFFRKATVTDNTSYRDANNNPRPPIEVPMHGAAVVLDVKTSQVRALASFPDFDVNRLDDDYAKIARNFLDAPMLNRATHAQLPPGSTVKPLVGLGAITDGIWTAEKGIECTGYLVLNGKRQPNGKCWTMGLLHHMGVGPDDVVHHHIPTQYPHRGRFGNPDGSLCFADALERSCNVYFENVAHMMGQEKLGWWLDHFGLGHETGLGISEACGVIPTSKDRLQPSVVCFGGIGQVCVQATPVQMANAVATIARGGIWMKPKLLVGDVKTTPVPMRGGRTLPDRVDLKLSPAALAAAKEGMIRVVNEPSGTGYIGAYMAEIFLAGKTGTAQASEQFELEENGQPKKDLEKSKPGKDVYVKLPAATYDHPTKTPWYRGWGDQGNKFNHAWFVGFAPAEDPQIAIAVMVEYGGSGGIAAGDIAKKTLLACVRRGYLTSRMPVAVAR
ncbi:MAG TPA: penicillin-binding transpeptidase domain-containing protein [Tepidisphaeraceae bacterium]|jgi:penicillin-binding protein 2